MTKMDELGNNSLREFQDYYERIWKLYRRYGDRVIEVEFEEGEEELKEIFEKSNKDLEFQSELIKFWKQNFQIVINSCADIEKAYTPSDIENRIYIAGMCERDRLCITKEFFQKIQYELYYRTEGIVYVLAN